MSVPSEPSLNHLGRNWCNTQPSLYVFIHGVLAEGSNEAFAFPWRGELARALPSSASFWIHTGRGAATDSGPPGQHIHSGPPAFRGVWGGVVGVGVGVVNVNKNIANHFHCCYRKRANNIYIIKEHFHWQSTSKYSQKLPWKWSCLHYEINIQIRTHIFTLLFLTRKFSRKSYSVSESEEKRGILAWLIWTPDWSLHP